MGFNKNIENLHKLLINDTFNLHIQKCENFRYNFEDQIIDVSGYGLYDSNIPVRGLHHRFYLELNINGKTEGKTLVVIMMNPSNTFSAKEDKPSTVDDTVKNIIRMAYRLGYYSKIVILNSFALINGNGKTAHPDNTQKQNLKIIESFIKENKESDYLLAWGKNAYDINKISKFLKDNISTDKFFVYRTSGLYQKYPCHPSKVVENRYKYVSEFLNSNETNTSFIRYVLP